MNDRIVRTFDSFRSKTRRGNGLHPILQAFDAASVEITFGGVKLGPTDLEVFTTHSQLDEAFGKGSLGR